MSDLVLAGGTVVTAEASVRGPRPRPRGTETERPIKTETLTVKHLFR